MTMVSQMCHFTSSESRFVVVNENEYPNAKDEPNILAHCQQMYPPSPTEVQNFDDRSGDDPNAAASSASLATAAKKMSKLQQMLALSSLSNKFLPTVSATQDLEIAPSLQFIFDKVGVPDGPSQRAISLLISRSPSTHPLQRGVRLPISVKTHNWDGAELCDDP